MLLVNYGALMLRALFEHWPQANASSDDKESGSLSQVPVMQHAYTYSHMHMYVNTTHAACTHITHLCHTNAHAHTVTHTNTHAHTQARAHTSAHTHKHTHIQCAPMYIHMHIYMHTR